MSEKAMRIDLESQLFYRAMEATIGKNKMRAENSVRLLLDGGMGHQWVNALYAPLYIVAGYAEHSAVYLLDDEASEFFSAAYNAEMVEDLTTLELPPLPYPQLLFESMDGAWHLAGGGGELSLFCVSEEQRGERWILGFLIHTYEDNWNDELREQLTIGERISPGLLTSIRRSGYGQWRLARLERSGEVWEIEPSNVPGPGTYMVEDDDLKNVRLADDHKAVYSQIVELVHLITARGVQTVSLPYTRAQRRRSARKGIDRAPTVYTVRIGGGTQVAGEGPGTREYHCRWLVRGHWRYMAQTNTRTWVRPHIKGPAGAPWKGRPVYVA